MPYLRGIIWPRNKLGGNTYLFPVQGVRNIASSEKCCRWGYGRPKRGGSEL